VDLDGKPYTIVGVMPRDFYFPSREARLWTAMRFAPSDFEDRTNTYIYGVGRLAPGVTLERARAEMAGVAARISRANPKEMDRIGVSMKPLQEAVSPESVMLLKVLMAAAGCVLLIACANLAGMLLARALARRRELAVRTALGAGRERLLRHMLTESLLLASCGAVVGIALANAALPLLARLVPTDLPMSAVPAMDGRVLGFAVLATCVTGLVFGWIPAWQAGRAKFATDLTGGRSAAGARRERVRAVLVACEIAGSIVLLVGFGLLMRALWRVEGVDPGFRADHVMTVSTPLPMPKYEKIETRELFYRRVIEQARALPGVTDAAYVTGLPILWGGGIWAVQIAGHPVPLAQRGTSALRFVTPGYFAAMRIPLLSGRDVQLADTAARPFVAVVSASFVKQHFPREDPIGRHFDIGNHDREIVGVVGDVHSRTLESASEPQVYCPELQLVNGVSTWYAPRSLVVRTGGDAASLAPSLRRIIHEADAAQPVTDVETMEEVVDSNTASRRVQLAVLGAFACMAFLLAAAGIHGLLAFTVSTRTQEIGIRVALGARRTTIARMLVGEALALAIAGTVLGALAAYAAARLLTSLLAGIQPDDPVVYGTAAALAAAMAMAGSFWPAIRAARIDPATAMRAE
jgi:putative ABC transport system permease protein